MSEVLIDFTYKWYSIPVIIAGAVILSMILAYFAMEYRTSIYESIDILDCYDLKEFILSGESGRKYAEHRYEWMCEK